MGALPACTSTPRACSSHAAPGGPAAACLLDRSANRKPADLFDGFALKRTCSFEDAAVLGGPPCMLTVPHLRTCSDLKGGNVLMASRIPTHADPRGFICKVRRPHLYLRSFLWPVSRMLASTRSNPYPCFQMSCQAWVTGGKLCSEPQGPGAAADQRVARAADRGLRHEPAAPEPGHARLHKHARRAPPCAAPPAPMPSCPAPLLGRLQVSPGSPAS
jgi:hypothetical protein